MRAYECFNSHITMSFDNDTLASITWAKGTYSDGGETTAEVACFSADGKWMVYSFDEQKFYILESGAEVMRDITPNQLVEILNKLTTL